MHTKTTWSHGDRRDAMDAPPARPARPALVHWTWNTRTAVAWFAVFAIVLVATAITRTLAAAAGSLAIRGTVSTERGPVAGARVRVQATEVSTITDNRGEFVLPWPSGTSPVTVTAWADGTYVGSATATPGGPAVAITLKPIYATDNVDYEWLSDDGARGGFACSHCMPAANEWLRDAHSRSALNPRFLSMYSGTDLNGHQSPPTRFAEGGDHTRLPLPPNPQDPYYGPGFKLDHPDQTGTCAACHVPVAAVSRGGLEQADPRRVEGVALDGVACEFCHKIGEVALDPTTRLPKPDMPGTLSIRLFRPAPGQQLFFGSLDDVTRRVSYLPLEEQSAFCAPCHHGVFSGVTVYDSYGEWLASPYSDPRTGKTCQRCHMAPAGYDFVAFPEKGGLHRNPVRILSHQMPGAASETLLRNAVSLTAEGHIEGDRLTVTVRITNDRTGHDVPSDSPLRHLILLVSARGNDGRPLTQVEGPTVPTWGGVGDPQKGHYAGLPGKGLAKVLQEIGTNEAPTAAYWNPTRIISDNRIAPFASDTSSYAFAVRPGENPTVEVTLIFRRAYKALADLKEWSDPDIVMATQRVPLEPYPRAATRTP